MKILLAPFARALRDNHDNRSNPKDYPWGKELAELLIKNGHQVIQVGCTGEEQVTPEIILNPTFQELEAIIKDADTFIAVDSYLQHLCWFLNKKGIALWGQSDPRIFGHRFHINLLKDRKYLRPDPFNVWEARTVIPEAFVSPQEILEALSTLAG